MTWEWGSHLPVQMATETDLEMIDFRILTVLTGYQLTFPNGTAWHISKESHPSLIIAANMTVRMR